MDEIRIRRLQVYAYHGVYPEETRLGQVFYVNAVLYTDTRAAGIKDDLHLSTNYGQVCSFIHDYMLKKKSKLLETVAEGMAEAILLAFPLVQQLDLEIEKPQAPIPHPFEAVSVKIHRGWHRAYIAVGSNMGNREQYIANAFTDIGDCPQCRIGKVSSLYVTEPYGGVAEGSFLNGVFELGTLLTPEELLALLHSVEENAGRERTVHWGSRTLDLDILFYDREVIMQEHLMIPHVDMKNREFVLEPMCEIAPYFLHPVFHKTMMTMLLELQGEEL